LCTPAKRKAQPAAKPPEPDRAGEMQPEPQRQGRETITPCFPELHNADNADKLQRKIVFLKKQPTLRRDNTTYRHQMMTGMIAQT
jgi:hypothetical protein